MNHASFMGHCSESTPVRVGRNGDHPAFIEFGMGVCVNVFMPDEKLVELRDAIDTFLAKQAEQVAA